MLASYARLMWAKLSMQYIHSISCTNSSQTDRPIFSIYTVIDSAALADIKYSWILTLSRHIRNFQSQRKKTNSEFELQYEYNFL